MYESYFRLREAAFKETPDPRFFFATPSHQEALATLGYGIEQRKGIIVLTGETGTGKTTLLRSLVRNAERSVHSVYIVDPHLDFIEVLQCALEAFGLPSIRDDRFVMLRRLHGYCVEQSKNHHIVALLFDEAQGLKDNVLEELKLLSDLEDRGASLVQIVLIGQTQLEKRLAQPSLRQLDQRVALRARLGRLPIEDLNSYIVYRLSVAGYVGHVIFVNAAIGRVALYSKGLPRLINLICDHALLIACATSRRQVSAAMIDRVADELHLRDDSFALPVLELDTLGRDTPDYGAGEAITGARRESRTEAHPSVKEQKNRKLSLDDNHDVNKPYVTSGPEKVIIYVIFFIVLSGSVFVSSWPEYSVELSAVSGQIENLRDLIKTIHTRIESLLRPGVAKEGNNKEGATRHSWRKNDSLAIPVMDLAAESLLPEKSSSTISTEANSFDSEAGTNLSRKHGAVSGRPIRPRHLGRIQNYRKENSIAHHLDIRVVVGNSLIRDKPTSDAQIISTLFPGTKVQVEFRMGRYWKIRSMEPHAIQGYVHREDAFFEPVQ